MRYVMAALFFNTLVGCKTGNPSAEVKSWDDVASVDSDSQGSKTLECLDGRVQRVVKVDENTYEIRESGQSTLVVSQQELAARICDTGNGDDGDGPLPAGVVKSFTIEPSMAAGGLTYLVPLYQLGNTSRIRLRAAGAKLRINDAIVFDMEGGHANLTALASDDFYLEVGQSRQHIVPGSGKRFSSIAIRAESIGAQGSLTIEVAHRVPIDFPQCQQGTQHEVGGGCYSSSACYLPGGGCGSSSACYPPGGGCHSSSACYVAGGGCYSSSACYLPEGGCYSGSACYPPGGSCTSSSECRDRNGREINPKAGMLVVNPSLFKYAGCEFNPQFP